MTINVDITLGRNCNHPHTTRTQYLNLSEDGYYLQVQPYHFKDNPLDITVGYESENNHTIQLTREATIELIRNLLANIAHHDEYMKENNR